MTWEMRKRIKAESFEAAFLSEERRVSQFRTIHWHVQPDDDAVVEFAKKLYSEEFVKLYIGSTSSPSFLMYDTGAFNYPLCLYWARMWVVAHGSGCEIMALEKKLINHFAEHKKTESIRYCGRKGNQPALTKNDGAAFLYILGSHLEEQIRLVSEHLTARRKWGPPYWTG